MCGEKKKMIRFLRLTGRGRKNDCKGVSISLLGKQLRMVC